MQSAVPAAVPAVPTAGRHYGQYRQALHTDWQALQALQYIQGRHSGQNRQAQHPSTQSAPSQNGSIT